MPKVARSTRITSTWRGRSMCIEGALEVESMHVFMEMADMELVVLKYPDERHLKDHGRQ